MVFGFLLRFCLIACESRMSHAVPGSARVSRAHFGALAEMLKARYTLKFT